MTEQQTIHKSWGQLNGLLSEPPPEPPQKKARTLERLFLLLSGRYPYAEDSLSMRISVMLCEITSLFSTFIALEYPKYWYLYLIFLISGHIYSYKSRKHGACLMNFFISLYMLVILGNFFINLIASPYSTNQSLVMLLTGLLVGHSFDLPRRRDLNYSILVSLLLLGFSATIFNTMMFAINLGVYLIFFSQAVHFYCLSQNRNAAFIAHNSNKLEAAAEQPIVRNRFIPLKAILKRYITPYLDGAAFYLLTFLLVATIIFVTTPRFSGLASFRLQTNLHFNLNLNRDSTHGELIDPSSPSSLKNLLFGKKRSDNTLAIISPNDDLGINNPASPSESKQLAMQIRTNSEAPLYCRGLAYRHYNGRQWTIDQKSLPHEVSNGSFLRPSPPMFSRSFYKQMYEQGLRPPRPSSTEITTQIFYIEHDINNVIFTPYWPMFAQYPTETFFIDRDNGLRSPNILEKGTIYTINSVASAPLIPDKQAVQQLYAQFNNAQKLDYEQEAWQEALNFRGEPPSLGDNNPLPREDLNRREYKELLNLPDNITARTRFLTMRLTNQYSDPALKVLALAHFLRSNCNYIDPAPSVPSNKELTDYFIFTTKMGNCRNFASSLAVMCRIIGIPSRYVCGYVARYYNPFTGNYEVYLSDLHAWTEVFLESYDSKWVTVDAVSPNQIGGRKVKGARFNLQPLLKYLAYKFNFIQLSELKKSFSDPWFYFELTVIILTLSLNIWIFSNYQTVNLAMLILFNSDLPFSKRLIAAGRLSRLSFQLKIWQQTSFNSDIERLYSFIKILLTSLRIYQAPGQTIRQFCETVTDTKISSILQHTGKLYEKELYAQSEFSEPLTPIAQQNLSSFFKHLSTQTQKELLSLLTINPSDLHRTDKQKKS